MDADVDVEEDVGQTDRLEIVDERGAASYVRRDGDGESLPSLNVASPVAGEAKETQSFTPATAYCAGAMDRNVERNDAAVPGFLPVENDFHVEVLPPAGLLPPSPVQIAGEFFEGLERRRVALKVGTDIEGDF